MATKTTTRKITTRKLPLAVLTAGLVFSASQVSALGLGTLDVKSNLDQPLEGTIELLLAPGDDVGTITAAIASKEDFQPMGIDYHSYLNDVSLSVENMGGGSYVLRVVSNNVVIKEPFIHFLVRVDWSGGSMLREYTALIDPPVYAADAPKSVAEPSVVGADETFQTEPEPPTADPAMVEPEPLAADIEPFAADPEPLAADTGPQITTEQVEPELGLDYVPTDAQYGPVVRGESLSMIAEELQHQYPDLSIYQIMKVLFEENRSSFIDDNINGLRKGAVLNIGDLSVIREVDLAAAKQFFYEQVNDWESTSLFADSGFDDRDSLLVGQDEYSFDDSVSGSENESYETATYGDSEDAFQVGASNQIDAVVSSGDTDTSDAEVLAMRMQISELETSLASSALENQELSERISLLEGQLADMNRLISMDVENSDLAAVEAVLAEQNNATNVNGSADEVSASSSTEEFVAEDNGFVDPLAGLADGGLDSGLDNAIDSSNQGQDAPLANAELQNGVSAGQSIAGEAGLSSGEPEEFESVSEVAEPTATVTVKPEKSTSFFSGLKDRLFDGGLWSILAGASVLILGGVGVWITRRRRADEEFEISMMSIQSQSHTESEERSLSSPTEEDKTKTADRETSFLTVYSDSDVVVQADEVDPVAEADVYIAYGRDEQAEEVLLDGIASKPSRVDIKQKLLSLYHKNNNIEGFERIAEELYSQKNFLTKNVWQEVSLMGKDMSPDNPLFAVSTSDLLADKGAEDNMITSGDAVDEVDSFLDSTSAITMEADGVTEVDGAADSDRRKSDYSEDAQSHSLINFEDAQSEVSELDEVAPDALNLSEDEDQASVAVSASAVYDDIEETGIENELINVQGRASSIATGSSDQIDDKQETHSGIGAGAAEGQTSDSNVSPVAEVSDLEIGDNYDEARTQYELAKVFVDLGDADGARKILDDIVANNENNQEVLNDASNLLASINA